MKRQWTLDEKPIAPITIYRNADKSRRPPSRIAMLWSPVDNLDVNLASKRLITEVLGVEIMVWSEKNAFQVRFQGQPIVTEGFVELDWGLDNPRSRRVYRTRFLVTAEEDPPFDIVLGRKNAVAYGLSRR